MKKSFLKWSESNYFLLEELIPLLHSFKKSNIKEQTFIEPFMGSGSVFLNIEKFNNYILNDLNVNIFMLFNQIKQDKDILIEDCKELFKLNNDKETYKLMVEKYNKSNDYYEKCVILIYLNRYSFNNMIRFNQAGKYNAAFGNIKRPYLPNIEIENMNKKLNNGIVQIFNHSFERIFENLEYADVIYCDPPNISTKILPFSIEKHKLLNDLAMNASMKGSIVIISNEYNELTKELYKDCAEYYIKKIKNSNKEEMIAIYA